MFIEKPANNQSIAQRKLVRGIGFNDAAYIVNLVENGTQSTCPFYSRWQAMLKRCYSSEYQSKNPTYIDCSVCEDWLTFSKFKAWMVNQDWENKDIDKDIINPGNKVYSPDNCVFISHDLNSLLNENEAGRGCHPRGVTWSFDRNRFISRVNFDGKNKYIGSYKTKELAHEHYIIVKIKIILQAADEQTDPRVANGLRLHAELLNKH